PARRIDGNCRPRGARLAERVAAEALQPGRIREPHDLQAADDDLLRADLAEDRAVRPDAQRPDAGRDLHLRQELHARTGHETAVRIDVEATLACVAGPAVREGDLEEPV